MSLTSVPAQQMRNAPIYLTLLHFGNEKKKNWGANVPIFRSVSPLPPPSSGSPSRSPPPPPLYGFRTWPPSPSRAPDSQGLPNNPTPNSPPPNQTKKNPIPPIIKPTYLPNRTGILSISPLLHSPNISNLFIARKFFPPSIPNISCPARNFFFQHLGYGFCFSSRMGFFPHFSSLYVGF